MTGNLGTFADSPELRDSYELCAQVVREAYPSLVVATDTLPPAVQPALLAIHSFAFEADRLADEGPAADRERVFSRWRAEFTAELSAGHSRHPLRRAWVDAMRRWDLDRALLDEHLDAAESEVTCPLVFEEWKDLRGFLRAGGGSIAKLWAPFLGASGPEALRLLSLLGEALTLADMFQDFPKDLAAGLVRLPRADLRQLGLEVADLGRGVRSDRLDELVRLQARRALGLLEQAAPVVAVVEKGCRIFVQNVLLQTRLRFEETEILQSRVLTDGLMALLDPGCAGAQPAALEVGPVPGHVAMIMDGNRRWAAQWGLPAEHGHRAGRSAASWLVYAALRLGIRHLSLYVFSTENWARSQEEIAFLFDMLAEHLSQIAEWLHALGVRVRWCGRRDRIEPSLASALVLLESMTSGNRVMTLNICADYGGREELADAARTLATEAVAGRIRPEDIGPADLARHLYVPELPDVDLLIRTSGEMRISNFLPWHLAYAELVFDPTLWPDFGLARLRDAVTVYASRQRRFGRDLPGQTRPAQPAGVG